MRYEYNLGKVVMTPKGEYDDGTLYEKLDFVTYNGSSYVAKGETRNNLPTNQTYWQLLAERGSSGGGGYVSWDNVLDKPDFAEVATSGSYTDLLNKPTIPAPQIQSNWNEADNTKVDYIKNKPSLATVATSGSYNDLTNKPTIPTVPVQDVTVGGTSVVSNGTAVIPQEVFWATYGTTTVTEIETAITAGKVVMCYYNNNYFILGKKDGNNHYYFTTSTGSSYDFVRIKISNNEWSIGSGNLERTANKITSISSSSTNVQYPTAKCVYANLTLKEDISNKVTSFQSTPDDTHYPSEKLVKDYVDGICGNIQTILTSI